MFSPVPLLQQFPASQLAAAHGGGGGGGFTGGELTRVTPEKFLEEPVDTKASISGAQRERSSVDWNICRGAACSSFPWQHRFRKKKMERKGSKRWRIKVLEHCFLS